jgi:endo-alpha-1,4-polygalactosaminidase (GH114 family)
VVLQTCNKLNKLKLEDLEGVYIDNVDILSYIQVHGYMVLYYTLKLMYEVKIFMHMNKL